MVKIDVRVVDWGTRENKKYYVTYKINAIDLETMNKLLERVDEEIVLKSGNLYLTVYFKEKYFPFRSKEAKEKIEDFIAREEIEMMTYLLSILEDD
jgi:Family of unknown function (DUF5750)